MCEIKQILCSNFLQKQINWTIQEYVLVWCNYSRLFGCYRNWSLMRHRQMIQLVKCVWPFSLSPFVSVYLVKLLLPALQRHYEFHILDTVSFKNTDITNVECAWFSSVSMTGGYSNSFWSSVLHVGLWRMGNRKNHTPHIQNKSYLVALLFDWYWGWAIMTAVCFYSFFSPSLGFQDWLPVCNKKWKWNVVTLLCF